MHKLCRVGAHSEFMHVRIFAQRQHERRHNQDAEKLVRRIQAEASEVPVFPVRYRLADAQNGIYTIYIRFKYSKNGLSNFIIKEV